MEWMTEWREAVHSPRMKKRISHLSPLFILFLAALSSLPPFATDMGLPAIPQIAKGLGTTQDLAAMTLTLFLFGFAGAPILYGPLSDHYGRKPVLLFGCTLFAAMGLACAFTSSIEWLLIFRFFQGAGAGAGSVMVMAIVRDLFDGKESRKLLSYVSVVTILAPMIAPTVGSLLLQVSSWRVIYGVLGVGGVGLVGLVVFGYEESRSRSLGVPFSTRQSLASYAAALRNHTFRGYVMMRALGFAGLFAYVTGSPLVMMDALGLSTGLYGFLFAMTAFGIMCGSFLSGRLSYHDVDPDRILLWGMGLPAIASILLVAVTLTGHASVPTMMPLLVTITFCLGLTGPAITQGALQPMKDIAGVASAFLNSVQMFTGAVMGSIVAWLYPQLGILAMTGGVMAGTVSALLAYMLVVRTGGRAETSRNSM